TETRAARATSRMVAIATGSCFRSRRARTEEGILAVRPPVIVYIGPFNADHKGLSSEPNPLTLGRDAPPRSVPSCPMNVRAGKMPVIGRPNAGKSTLVNRVVGEKVAIVSDKPQTTRKRILGVARRPGVELVLVDTPGIHRPEYRMNAAMVRDAVDA